MSTATVTERNRADSESAVRAPRFTGRGREMASLASALASPPAVVLVEGEAGVGKSRLVREYLAVAGESALVTCCPPFRRPHTLGPIADALRRSVTGVAGLRLSGLAGALRPLFPEWAGDLPPALEPAEDSSVTRHRLFGAMEELIGRLNVRLLVVEDVHWADEATLEFLLHLASGTPVSVPSESARPPVSLVITRRPEEVPEESLLRRLSRLASGSTGRRLAVGPLDITQTAALVSSMLADEPVSEKFAVFLHERTDGLPLAVEESVRLMSERSDLAFHDGAWERRPLEFIEVPLTVRDAVLERAAGLSTDAQAMLWTVAVLTDPATEATVRAVAGLPPERVQAGLSEVLASGILGDDKGLVTFRHILACQAVYESIPRPRARALHVRAAAALELVSPPPAAQLVRHFREAADIGKWAQYAEIAAERALAAGDSVAVAHLLHQLLTQVDLPASSVARLARMVPTVPLIGRSPFLEVLDVLKRALDKGGLTTGEEGDIRFQLGKALCHVERLAEGRAQLEQAIPCLEHDPGRQAVAMMVLALPVVTTWPAEVHLEWLRRAESLPSPVDSFDRMKFTIDKAGALLQMGAEQGWAEARKIPAHASTAYEMRNITIANINIGDAAVRWGFYDEAATRLGTALDLASSLDARELCNGAAVTQMHLDWFTGSWHGLAARAAARVTDEWLFRLEAGIISGLLEVADGARAHAEERLSAVYAEAKQRTEWRYVHESAAALARLWLADGRADDAVAITEAPMRVIVKKGIWLWATELAPARVAALAAAGGLGEAAELLSKFSEGLRAVTAPAPRAGLIMCEAMLAASSGDHTEAAELFARAAAAWQALPRPYDELLAREQQARSLLATGDENAALPVLSDAHDRLEALGARWDADRLAETMTGIRAPRGRGRPGYGADLSPRELEVVRLLAAGSTNQQIADTLVVARQTVASHVQAAMRKLNASSRAALAVSAAERGLMDGSRRREKS
jgi:DNA-binding NarL/FixJ family response regulator/MoxR-like ATPase